MKSTLLLLLVTLTLAMDLARAADPAGRVALSPPISGGISVHLIGPLHAHQISIAPDRASGKRRMKVGGASVDAGGCIIKLDWQGDSDIADEIAMRGMLRGTGGFPVADVAGRMVFQSARNATPEMQVMVMESTDPFGLVLGGSRLAPVPVVVVESIKFDGERVWARKPTKAK